MTSTPDDAVLPADVRQHLGLQLALFYADRLTADLALPDLLAHVETLERRLAMLSVGLRRDCLLHSAGSTPTP